MLLDFETGRTPDELRYLCSACLAAAHERKVVMNVFMAVEELVGQINNELIRLEKVAFVRAFMAKMDPAREFDWWDAATMPFIKKITNARGALASIVETLMECAPFGEKVH